MSAMGILDAAYVVFYHPLDNFTEYTQGQAWTGTAGFTAGKIGSANSAVAGDAFTYGGNYVANAGLYSPPIDIIAMDPSTVVVMYSAGAALMYVRVGSVSGTTVTYGAAVSPRVGIRGSLAPLDAARFVIVMHAFVAGGSGHAFVGTVSGLGVTFGAEGQYGGTAEDTSGHVVAVLAPDKFVVHWRQAAGALAIVGAVSGTSITFGAYIVVNASAASPNSETAISAVALSASKAVLANNCGTAGPAGTVKVHVATVSGLDITVGADTAPANASTVLWPHALVALTDTSVVMVHGGTARAHAGVVSGLSITWGSFASLFSPTDGLNNGITATRLTSTKFVTAVREEGVLYHTQVQVGTVSGTAVTMGSSSSPSTAFNSKYAQAVALTETKVAVVHAAGGTDPSVAVGSLDLLASISAPTPGAYPTAIGATRVAAAMWARNPTSGATAVLVERGYAVTLTATTVSLGGTTAVWSGAGIAALMTAMNTDWPGPLPPVGSGHLLVLDFENTSGTTWRLRTSLDGAPWVDQGLQTSGSQVVATTNTAPELTLSDAVIGGTQWIDELVLWAGDKAAFALFAPDELANLQDLADVFGAPMNQYEEYFGAPICWQATARMPDGSAWRDSGCGPCPPVVRVPRGASDVVVTDDGVSASPRIVEG